MKEGADILCDFRYCFLWDVKQSDGKSILIGIASVLVKISAVDKLHGKSRAVAFAYISENGNICVRIKFLLVSSGIIEADINNILPYLLNFSLPFLSETGLRRVSKSSIPVLSARRTIAS